MAVEIRYLEVSVESGSQIRRMHTAQSAGRGSLTTEPAPERGGGKLVGIRASADGVEHKKGKVFLELDMVNSIELIRKLKDHFSILPGEIA
jgi:hypothetical protein